MSKHLTKRDLARVHQLALELYVASKANPDDTGYMSTEDAWEYAFEFHMYSLEIWDRYNMLWQATAEPDDEEI